MVVLQPFARTPRKAVLLTLTPDTHSLAAELLRTHLQYIAKALTSSASAAPLPCGDWDDRGRLGRVEAINRTQKNDPRS